MQPVREDNLRVGASGSRTHPIARASGSGAAAPSQLHCAPCTAPSLKVRIAADAVTIGFGLGASLAHDSLMLGVCERVGGVRGGRIAEPQPKSERGACVDGACFAGLSCFSNVCVKAPSSRVAIADAPAPEALEHEIEALRQMRFRSRQAASIASNSWSRPQRG